MLLISVLMALCLEGPLKKTRLEKIGGIWKMAKRMIFGQTAPFVFFF